MEKVALVPLNYRLDDVQKLINHETDELCVRLQTSDHDIHEELRLEKISLMLNVAGDNFLYEPVVDPCFISGQDADGVIEIAFSITERSLGGDAFRIVRHYKEPVDLVGASRLCFTVSDKTEHTYDFTRLVPFGSLAWAEV